MPEADNMQVVKEFYAPSAEMIFSSSLGLLAPDVDWTFLGTKEIPFAGTRRGPDQVSKFFAIIAEPMQLEHFCF